MRIHLVLAAALLGTVTAGCSSDSSTSGGKPAVTTTSAAPTAATAAATASPKYADQPGASAASAPCGNLTSPDPRAAAPLPKGFPVLPGWVAVSQVVQGKTTAVRGVVTGLPSAITADRDAVFTQIKAAGYTVTGSDQEPGIEADGDFGGPHPGNINVKLLCQDHLLVTYTFNG